VTNADLYRRLRLDVDYADARTKMAAQMLDRIERGMGTLAEEEEGEGEEGSEEEEGGGVRGLSLRHEDSSDSFLRQDRNMSLFELQQRRSDASLSTSGNSSSSRLQHPKQPAAGDPVEGWKEYIEAAQVDTLLLALALFPLHLQQAERVNEFVELNRLFHHYDTDQTGSLTRLQWDALCLDVRCGMVPTLPGAKLTAQEAADIFHEAAGNLDEVEAAAAEKGGKRVWAHEYGHMTFPRFHWAWDKVKKICC
jgi:hypothetical protein